MRLTARFSNMATNAAGSGPSLALVLDQLACPVCFGKLQLAEDAITCLECGRGYPLIDGIPVLIAERATNSLSTGIQFSEGFDAKARES